MAKVHLDRLKKKYGDASIKGTQYSSIIKRILFENTSAMSKGMARKAKNKFETFSKRFRKKEQRLVLPSAEEVIPARAIQVSKSSQNGQIIADTLKDRMTQSLRKRLKTFEGESYITKRGVTAGRINPRLIDGFEEDLKEIFTNYTKRHPKFGVPKNVRSIATTEGRGAINMVKDTYVQKTMEVNPELVMRKVWIHHPSLSKEPRKGHGQVNMKSVPYNEDFLVNDYKKIKGRLVKVATDRMRYPHDSNAPASQVIGCNCDYDVVVSKRKKEKK